MAFRKQFSKASYVKRKMLNNLITLFELIIYARYNSQKKNDELSNIQIQEIKSVYIRTFIG